MKHAVLEKEVESCRPNSLVIESVYGTLLAAEARI
jgi:hypothetical protein